MNIDNRETQIAILEQIKKKVAPLCGAMESANFRGRARRIYELAKELQDDLRKANG